MSTAQRLGLGGTVITFGVVMALAVIGLVPTVIAQSQNNDATVIGLALNDIDSGTSASGTTTYTASAANRVRETTVTPTPNHSGASFVVKLGGVEDAAGLASLSVGPNVITAEVTAEDGQTTETYSETVTRAGNTPATGTPTISGTAEVPVEPPKAASRVSMWRMASPPEGRKSLVLNTVTMRAEATPNSRVTTPYNPSSSRRRCRSLLTSAGPTEVLPSA